MKLPDLGPFGSKYKFTIKRLICVFAAALLFLIIGSFFASLQLTLRGNLSFFEMFLATEGGWIGFPLQLVGVVGLLGSSVATVVFLIKDSFGEQSRW